MKSFSNETLNFFFRKFWVSYILDLAYIYIYRKPTRDIAFNRVIPITTVIVHECSEKIADPATSSFTE